ncbi:MAG: hypothetical protein HWE22_18085 [Flavobacteriales bacterium]|nr:hypothetical protein [Flavobacteriales bacterium]
MKDRILEIIKDYAKLYSSFEELQKDNRILPKGDQKTGVIGEYYGKCYADTLDKLNNAVYAEPGETFDLKYFNKKTDSPIRIQVKSVSAYSKTRTIAPLNMKRINGKKPFDYLYLIALDKGFEPIGFYINSYDEVFMNTKDKKSLDKVFGTKMKGGNSKGSGIYNFKNNLCGELRVAIACTKQ